MSENDENDEYEIYNVMTGFETTSNYNNSIGEAIHFKLSDNVLFISSVDKGKYIIYNSWLDFINKFSEHNISTELL